MRIPLSCLISSALLPVFLTSVAAAQAITGQVRSSTGAPVQGVNIDGFNSSGIEISLSGDGTDANGNFTTNVDEGPGVYTFVFYPPAPPITTHLVAERVNVVVVFTTDLGTITLGAGVLLSGRAVRTGDIPVPNVRLTVIDGPTGATVRQVQDRTNAFGEFDLAVPAHDIELQLNATTSAFVLGSRAFELSPSGATDLGDILLPPGAVVTGHVQRPNGAPVAGADLDFVNLSTGLKEFVPDDNTNSAGDFSVVVATATYDIEICPKPSDSLRPKRISNVTISTDFDLGTVVVGAGVRLFGTVLTATGAPAAGVDVEVFNATTGAELLLCNDNTSAAGAYSVTIPTGTYDVLFLRPPSLRGDLHLDVVVSGQTQLDGQLPPDSFGRAFSGAVQNGPTRMPLRTGKPPRGAGAPSGGPPQLTVSLTSDGAALELAGLPARARSWLLVGASPAEVALERGSARGRVLALETSARGTARIALEALGSARIFLRGVVHDPAHGLSFGPIRAFRP